MTAISPMRILTISSLYPSAARPNFGVFVERQCQNLAACDDVELTVINPIGLPPFPINLLARYSALRGLPHKESWNGLTVHRPRFRAIPKIGGPSNARNIASSILPLVQKLHQDAPFDLIDAEFFYPDGPAARHIAMALQRPFTIKARGADIHYWANHKGCADQILAAAQNSSAMLAVSQALKEDMAALGMPKDKIYVHYTGCDQMRFSSDAADKINRLPFSQDIPYSITIGALIARKNPNLIIEALAKVPDLHHIFIGDGEEEDRLKAQANALGIAGRVFFMGSLPHDSLPPLLAGARMLVLPSKSEGLANAWVEALACGTPIIISEAGGARELVRSDACGRIVDQTPSSIANAMHELLGQHVDRQMVRNSVANFTWSRNAVELRDIFAKVINDSASVDLAVKASSPEDK